MLYSRLESMRMFVKQVLQEYDNFDSACLCVAMNAYPNKSVSFAYLSYVSVLNIDKSCLINTCIVSSCD